MLVADPAGVDGRARGAHGGPREDGGEVAEKGEVLGALEAAAARDDDVGFGDVDLRALLLEDLGDPALDRAVGDGRRPSGRSRPAPRPASPSGKTFGRSVASWGAVFSRKRQERLAGVDRPGELERPRP